MVAQDGLIPVVRAGPGDQHGGRERACPGRQGQCSGQRDVWGAAGKSHVPHDVGIGRLRLLGPVFRRGLGLHRRCQTSQCQRQRHSLRPLAAQRLAGRVQRRVVGRMDHSRLRMQLRPGLTDKAEGDAFRALVHAVYSAAQGSIGLADEMDDETQAGPPRVQGSAPVPHGRGRGFNRLRAGWPFHRRKLRVRGHQGESRQGEGGRGGKGVVCVHGDLLAE